VVVEVVDQVILHLMQELEWMEDQVVQVVVDHLKVIHNLLRVEWVVLEMILLLTQHKV
tara:strand:- start:300 stop:473 length:174 start_codon:yes stop_codon:yes gene_type:complete